MDHALIERHDDGYLITKRGCGCCEETVIAGPGDLESISHADLDSLHASLTDQLELLLELRELKVMSEEVEA